MPTVVIRFRARAAGLFFAVMVLTSSVVAHATPTTQPASRTPAPAAQSQPSIRVFFSPDGGCTDAIVNELKYAQRTIDIQAYSFTSAPIAQAIVDAQKRGVKIRMILDKSQRTAKYTSATFLFNHDVPVFIDAKHAIAHNKIILIDGTTILTGSFNFTKAAEQSNAENLLIITGQPKLYAEYAANLEEHLGHAELYSGLAKD
jgi:phosphatidylserine/phosphatidylglycerophosphate/cardiolipin synthase-like enzyme